MYREVIEIPKRNLNTTTFDKQSRNNIKKTCEFQLTRQWWLQRYATEIDNICNWNVPKGNPPIDFGCKTLYFFIIIVYFYQFLSKNVLIIWSSYRYAYANKLKSSIHHAWRQKADKFVKYQVRRRTCKEYRSLFGSYLDIIHDRINAFIYLFLETIYNSCAVTVKWLILIYGMW